jgi:uracil phosphoribosyltransferase
MLAAGNSAVAAVDRLKEVNPKSIKFLCWLAAPEGVEYLHQQHSDVQIYTAAVDERLDDRNYIVPGLVPAGDGLHPATLRLTALFEFNQIIFCCICKYIHFKISLLT